MQKGINGTEITLNQHRAPHLCRHNASGPNKSLKLVVSFQLLTIINVFLLPSSAPLSRPDTWYTLFPHLSSRSRPHLLKEKKETNGKTASLKVICLLG